MAGKNTPKKYDQTKVSFSSVLVIDRSGTLHRLNCPFKVRVRNSAEDGISATIFYVDQVQSSEDYMLVYVIKSKPYPYFLFVILLY
jgi:hypothetical protein